MPNPLESPFEKLLVKLVRDGVVFTTVGGLAVCLNGFIRLTEDVDILVNRSPENIQRLLSSLATFGEGFARELSLRDFEDAEGAVRVVEATENCQVDLFTRMAGLHWEDFQAQVRHFATQGVQIPYLSPEALIRLKSGSLRERDRIDVLALREILRKHGEIS